MTMATPFIVKPKEQETSKETDWSLCVLCQKYDWVHLQNPAVYRGTKRENTGYISLANNIEILHELCALPFDRELIERVNDGSGIAETLIKNNAKWHADCKASCSNRDISRAKQRKAKAESPSSISTPVKKKLRFSTEKVKEDTKVCFFCNSDALESELHRASTLTFDNNVQHMANTLQDRKLIGKLAGGDAISKDIVYHRKCYTSLYNRFKAFERQGGPSKPTQSLKADSIVLAELVSYIEEFNDGKTVFKLAELVNMYSKLNYCFVYQLMGHKASY